MHSSIKQIDLASINSANYIDCYVGCLVLTKDKRITLQKRDVDITHYPDYLCEFGGHIEKNETPMHAIMRELKEELGANAKENDIIFLGAITEASSNHSELIYTYFWHDRTGSITGCYEGEARYFNDITSILREPKITDGLRWMLSQCKAKGLL